MRRCAITRSSRNDLPHQDHPKLGHAAKAGVQNDWSVCSTWNCCTTDHYYLVDLSRERFEYPRLRNTAIELARRFQPDVILIEEASTGIGAGAGTRILLTPA